MKMKKIMAAFVLLVVLAGSFWGVERGVYAKEAENENAVKAENLSTGGLDVMLVVDNSKSVWSQQEARNEALRCLGSLAVGGDINLGCTYFADHLYSTQMKLQSMEDVSKAKDVLSLDVFHMTEQDMANIDTNIGVGLKAAADAFADQNPSRKRVVILFSDGINENYAGDASYKAAANAYTKEQVQRLKEQGADLYCIYLQKRDSRDDVNYLKQLVNYFGNEDYTADRFKSVKEEDIDKLSEEFTKVFYAVQNGMKYKSIDLSAGGRTSFYVPSIGVNKLQIYLKNANPIDVTLSCLENSNHSTAGWQDGGNTFLTVENPTPGQWELEVKGEHAEHTTGTIAYYTDLSCYAEMVYADSNVDFRVRKNGMAKIRAKFYNGEGEEVQMDPAAHLEGILSYISEDGQTVTEYYELYATKDGADSSEFLIPSYGDYAVSIRLVYDEFVNLTYPMPAISVEPSEFVIKNMEGKNFAGYKNDEGGIRFTIDEYELIRDLEQEKIEIVEIIQGNPDNPVSVELERGYFVVNAKKNGRLHFEISVIDESGMTGVIKVEGKVRNKQMMDILKGILLGLSLLGIVLILRIVIQKYSLKKQIRERKELISKKCVNGALVNDKLDLEKSVELYKQFCEMRETVLEYGDDEAALDSFGLSKYLYEESDEQFRQNAEDMIAESQITANSITLIKQKADEMDDSGFTPVLEKKMGQLRSMEEEVEKLTAALTKQYEAYNGALEAMKEEIILMKANVMEFDHAMNQMITSTMKVSLNGGEYRGKFLGNKIAGYYNLVEDVKLLNRGGSKIETFTSLLGENKSLPNIFVFNFRNEDGEEGLMLRSKETFEIKEAALSGSGKQTKQCSLIKGYVYKLTIKGVGCFELEVE